MATTTTTVAASARAEIQHLQLHHLAAASAPTNRQPLTHFFVGLREIQARQGWNDPLSQNIRSWNAQVLTWYDSHSEITHFNIAPVKLQLDKLTQEILVDFWLDKPLEVVVNQQGDVVASPIMDFTAEGDVHVWDGLMWNQYKWVFDDMPINPFTFAPNFQTSMKVHELARDVLQLVAQLPEEIYDYPLKRVTESSTDIAQIDSSTVEHKQLYQFIYLQLIQGVLTKKHADAIIAKRNEEARQIEATTAKVDQQLAELKLETAKKIDEHQAKLTRDLSEIEEKRKSAVEALKNSMGLEIQNANTQLAVNQLQVVSLQKQVAEEAQRVQQLSREAQNLRNQLQDAWNDDDDVCTIL